MHLNRKQSVTKEAAMALELSVANAMLSKCAESNLLDSYLANLSSQEYKGGN